MYLGHEKTQTYLRDTLDAVPGLRNCVRLLKEVVTIKETADGGGFEVTTRDVLGEHDVKSRNRVSTSKTTARVFDAVAVCTGQLSKPSLPGESEIPGLSSFTGQTLHTSEYLDCTSFGGKKSLRRGAGKRERRGRRARYVLHFPNPKTVRRYKIDTFFYLSQASLALAAAALEADLRRERSAAREHVARCAQTDLQSHREMVLSVKRAAQASLTAPATTRLLRASLAVAVAALGTFGSGSVSVSSGNAFVSLSRARVETGDTNHARELAKELAKHRQTCASSIDRNRVAVASLARDATRFDFENGADAKALRLLPPGATRSGFGANGAVAETWWGFRPVPRGSHRVSKKWAQMSPTARQARLAAGAAALLKSVSQLEANAGALGFDASGAPRPSLIAPHIETLQSIAVLLGELTASTSSGEVTSVLDAVRAVLRAKGREVPRLPPKQSRVAGQGASSSRVESNATGRGCSRGRGGGRFGFVKFGQR